MPESKVQRQAAAIAKHHPEKLYKRNRGLLKMKKTKKGRAELSKMASGKEEGLPTRVTREHVKERIERSRKDKR